MNEPLITLGLDLSITSPGIVVLHERKLVPLFAPVIKTEPPGSSRREGMYGQVFVGSEEARVEYIRKQVVAALQYEPMLTYYENHAYGMRMQNASTQIHELMGVIKNLLHRGEWLAAPIAPTTLKKDATGDGRAKKPAMLEAARFFWPECPNHDVADAYHLARRALERYHDDVE